MQDLNSLSDEELQAIAGSAPAQQPSSMTNMEEMSDEELQQIAGVAPKKGLVENYITEPAKALATSSFRSLGNFGFDMADTAGAILESFESTKEAGTKFREFNKQSKRINNERSPEQFEMEKNNPISSAIGDAGGYVSGMLAGPAGVVRGGATALSKVPGAGKVMAETASEFPVTAGAVKGILENAIASASMVDQDKLKAGTIGGAFGGVLGGVGAAIGASGKDAGRYMAIGFDRARKLGYGATEKEARAFVEAKYGSSKSPEEIAELVKENRNIAFAMAREELATKGKVTTQGKIAQQGADLSQKQIDEIIPQSYVGVKEAPTTVVAKDIETSRKLVDEEVTAAYAPLTNSTIKVPIATPAKVKGPLKEYIPEPLPEQATFVEMQNYRQGLDASIKSANRAGKHNTVKQLRDIRAGITQGMQNVARQEGLEGQLKIADDLFMQKKLPYYTFSKANDANEIADKVGTLITAGKFQRADMDDLVSVLGGGVEGKQKAGWAILQTAMRGAQKGDMPFDIGSLNTQINKFSKLGLDDVFGTPAYKETVAGINKITATAKAGQNIREHHWSLYIVGPILSSLSQSPKGMKLLRFIGSPKSTAVQVRDAIDTLFQRAITAMATKLTDQTPTKQEEAPQ